MNYNKKKKLLQSKSKKELVDIVDGQQESIDKLVSELNYMEIIATDRETKILEFDKIVSNFHLRYWLVILILMIVIVLMYI